MSCILRDVFHYAAIEINLVATYLHAKLSLSLFEPVVTRFANVCRPLKRGIIHIVVDLAVWRSRQARSLQQRCIIMFLIRCSKESRSVLLLTRFDQDYIIVAAKVFYSDADARSGTYAQPRICAVNRSD